ncbi:MAG: ribokinase [Erysipelotrichaceae bacterium]|nr:ribokinase [Erysipelotrichaceae bacterium]
MSKITVVGSFSMDLTVTMDTFPKEGQTIIGKKMLKNPGGKGANQCIACARLGGDVEMIGMLGDDENGRIIKDLFIKEGVNVSHVLTTDLEPTTIALIEIDASAQNKIVVVPAANFVYSIEDLQNVKEVIANTEMVVAQLEMRLDVMEELAKMCQKLNVPLILNPAPAVPLSDELLSRVTYLTPNETELSVLTGHPVDTLDQMKEAAQMLLDRGVKHVIATLGDKGALLADASGMKVIAGYKVHAIDTVAAGDSFNGALAKALVDGKSLEEAILLANAVGALTVTRHGAVPSLPTKSEVEEFIKTH